MSRTIAFVRKPGFSFIQAISSHPERHTINVERALSQHQHYVSVLKENGIKVIAFPPLEECPDAPFVEDTTLVFGHMAVACSNKEKSRQGESRSIHAEIKKYRRLETLPESATLDGGDVLDTKEKLFVGISRRTNLKAVDALTKLTRRQVIPVEVYSGLHLKTAATYLGKNTLVVNSCSIKTSVFDKFKCIETEETDQYAANCLAIGDKVLMAAGTKNLATNIQAEGFKTIELDMSEFEKADGGLTCLSIIFKKDADKIFNL